MIFRDAGSAVAKVLAAVVEVAYPESCVLCGAFLHQADWCAKGSHCAGLRPWDRPHLCRPCQRRLAAGGPVVGDLVLGDGSRLPVLGTGPVTGDLVRVVGTWKYHGIRGLAWPLAEKLAGILRFAVGNGFDPGTLLPVPLHRRRQGSRGFNQSALLAVLAGSVLDLPVAAGPARRVRDTGQQARLDTRESRFRNMDRAFRARPPAGGEGRRLTLVDDLVTSGATARALAETMREAGWEVELVVALGLARFRVQPAVPVDTPGRSS